MRGLLLVAMLLVPVISNAAIYKCPNAGGGVEFSDKPCGGAVASDESRVEAKATEIGGSFDVSREQKELWGRAPKSAQSRVAAPPRRNYCKSYSSTALRSIVVSNGVEPGMGTGAVGQSWGRPNVINGGYPEQWVYRWRTGTSYVYFVDGCVWKVDGGYGR